MKPIQSVLIVGGGTAGWLAASFLASAHGTASGAGLRITLVESAEIGIIGVGEGTFPSIRGTLAAIGLEPVDEIVVAYSVQGVSTSSGTRRTIGRVMRQPLAAFENGILVESHFGATTRRVQFPFGERDVVEWGGTEPFTVPRHTNVRNVRSYLRASKLVARSAGLAQAAAPLIRLAGSVGRGPGERRRAKCRFAVVAEARRPSSGRRVTLTGSDPYGLTALLIAHGAEALAKGEVSGAGALAPAEAFDARELIAALDPLLRIDSENDLF